MARLEFAFTVALLSSLTSSVIFAEGTRQFPELGRVATQMEINAWDIAIGPRGGELPTGSGSVAEGREVYAQYCAYCHGATGVEGPDNRLVGGQGSLDTDKPVKTIGSYWPYATTLFDYISRAMPFPAPGSLTPDQVYAVTAFLLHANDIIEEDTVLTDKNLATLVMPNRHGFMSDGRPEEFGQR